MKRDTKRAAPPSLPETDNTRRETGTTARTIIVLRAVADSPEEPTLGDLAESVNLPLSTTHRLLDLLMKEGMVERDDIKKTFRPGMEFFRLASKVVGRLSLSAVARPYLEAATRECGESAYLGGLESRTNKLVFLAHVESKQLLDYRVPLHTTTSLTTGASGRAILAWLDTERIQEIIRSEASQGAYPANASEKKELLASLSEIRERGYANTFGKRIPGAVGFFAPVFDGTGQVCASFGFTVPEVRFDARISVKLAEAIMRHGAAMSKALGYAHDYPPKRTP